VVAKHRRSEEAPWLAPVGAPVHMAEWGPETGGYGHPAPAAVHAGDGYPSSRGYDGAAVEPGWAAPPGHPWPEPQNWQDWGPPPALPPDHPSAPMPRVQVRADDPSWPVPAPRLPGAPTCYQRQTRPRRQETTDYRHETGPWGPGPGPASGRVGNGRSPNRNPMGTAGHVLPPADRQAARIAQEAQDYADALCEAAEHEAAAITQDATDRAGAITRQATEQAVAIREAAERDAAELRARLDSMSGELGRVAAYVTENLSVSPGSAPEPAEVTAGPAAKAATVPRPTSTGKPPASAATTRPPPAARPAGVATITRPGPARQTGAKPAGRQAKTMRKMVAALAAVSVIGVVSGTTELVMHGFPFFMLRANGAGAGESGPKEPANPVLPTKADEVKCSVLHLACTVSASGASRQPGAHRRSATHHQPTTGKK
jgi:hypothetical protein